MPGERELRFEILEDGTIKLDTNKIDDAIHSTADSIIAEVEKLAGTEAQVTRKFAKARDVHHNEEIHVHDHS